MSQFGLWPCGCDRRQHTAGPCIYADDERAAANEIERLVRPPLLKPYAGGWRQQMADQDGELKNEPATTLPRCKTYLGTTELPDTAFSVPEDWRVPVTLAAIVPRLISNSAEADRVNLLWEKGLLWEDDGGKLSADPPAPKPSRLRELLQRNGVGSPEIPVTEDMVAAAIQACDDAQSIHWNDMAPAIYRAMAAVAPVELVSAAEDRIAALEADNATLRSLAQKTADQECVYLREITQLRDALMVRADEAGAHPYHGPTKDGKAISDEVHERFHKALGDVATGGVMRPARDQMEKALADAKAKDGKAPQPIRGITRSGDPRIGGWMA